MASGHGTLGWKMVHFITLSRQKWVHSLLSLFIHRRQFRALLAFNFIFLKNYFRQDKAMSFFPCVFHHLLRKCDLVLQKSMLRSFSPGISKILILSITGTTVLPWYRQCSVSCQNTSAHHVALELAQTPQQGTKVGLKCRGSLTALWIWDFREEQLEPTPRGDCVVAAGNKQSHPLKLAGSTTGGFPTTHTLIWHWCHWIYLFEGELERKEE